MKSLVRILRVLLPAVLSTLLCACRPATTFAEQNPIPEIYDASGMDVPDGTDQFPVNGPAVMDIIRDAVPSGTGFTPSTMVTLFDNEGGSYLLFFSKDRRHFLLDDHGWRLTRRQARAVNKLI